MKKKKMSFIKRMMITIVVLAIGSLTSFLYIYHNFSTYFIYYAKHIPHEKGANPEMVFIVDYLDYLDYLGESSIKGLKYSTDGYNAIVKNHSFSVRQGVIHVSSKYEVSIYKGTDEEIYRIYLFDKSGKFMAYYYQKPGVKKGIYDKSTVRQKEAQSYVDEVINPIVEKMETKPSVNLQWLFNKIYQKRFE
ncbi:hypothetical protein [Streptococcus sp.]|nr:hypothetical protein [Streptococcus sp.]MDY3823520.1 hypothetical protein [Streptococcus sp.]